MYVWSPRLSISHLKLCVCRSSCSSITCTTYICNICFMWNCYNFTDYFRFEVRSVHSQHIISPQQSSETVIFSSRLSVLHGPAMAFLPPLLAYKTQNICPYTDHDNVPPEFWMGRMREVSIFA